MAFEAIMIAVIAVYSWKLCTHTEFGVSLAHDVSKKHLADGCARKLSTCLRHREVDSGW